MKKKKVIRLKKQVKTFIKCCILLIVLILIGGFLLVYNSSFFVDKKYNNVESKNVAKEVVKKPKEYSIKMLMVGDALIHTSIYNDAKMADGTYDFKPMLEYIKPIASKYDIAYYNQETILGGESLGYSNYPRFNSPQEVGDAFIDAGFNMVSLATNHTMDKGEVGVVNSVNYWKSKEGVVTSGQWISQEERDKVNIYEKNNIKYAFFSYTTCTNGLETPYGKEYLNNVYSYEKASNDIKKVVNDVDFVIVAMHWGTEYSFGVSYEQEKISKELSDLGVDLIIGAHPHVVEPVEYINDGKTLVIYSLGNVISDQIGNEKLTGLMMEVTLKKNIDINDNVTNSVVDPKAELIYTKAYMRQKRDFKVYPYPMLNNTLLPNYMGLYEQYKAIVNSRYPELVWGITGEE